MAALEQKQEAIEKEALAIVESLRKWIHYLIGRPFRLITDQKCVAFMFDSRKRSKIKNDKIQRWRMELSQYSYDCVHRPGKDNLTADMFSRVTGPTGQQGVP